GAKAEVWNRKDRYGWTPLMIAEGVQRVNNIRPSEPTANAIRAAMIRAGSPVTETGADQTAQQSGRVRFEFVKITPGEYMMGCSNADTDCLDDERPAHRVRITKGFEMGKYEVTQAQWESVMGNNPSHFKGAERPVESVSWNDVQRFLQKLNGQHDGYR